MHWALAVVALTVLAFAAISGGIAGTPITAAMVFTADRYAGWFESHPRDARPRLEASEVREVRWRFGVGHSRR